MLADADGIDADLVGEDRLLDQVADHLRGRERPAVRACGDVTEGVETELDCAAHQRMIPKKPAPEQAGRRPRLCHGLARVVGSSWRRPPSQ